MSFFETWFMLIVLPGIHTFSVTVCMLVCLMYIVLCVYVIMDDLDSMERIVMHNKFFKFVNVLGLVCMLLSITLPGNKTDIALMYIVPEITTNKNISEKSLYIIDNVVKNMIVFKNTQKN